MSTISVVSPGKDVLSYRLANMAAEYCHLIDGLEDLHPNPSWRLKMSRLLSRLHMAVIHFNPEQGLGRRYCLPDDDQRCELYLHLIDALNEDACTSTAVHTSLDAHATDILADDFTDMYFDLKLGLDMFESDPQQAVKAWLNSFYQHWGIHLLDAENRLQGIREQEKPYH